jgi:PAS domain-containing protein
MKGAVLHRPHDVRYEERQDPTMIEPTDAILRMAATCVCGSDLWPYRGIDAEAILARLKGHETLRDYRARLRCKDGAIKGLLINSNVLWFEGEFIHIRSFTRDVTERKRLEAQLATPGCLR